MQQDIPPTSIHLEGKHTCCLVEVVRIVEWTVKIVYHGRGLVGLDVCGEVIVWAGQAA